YQTIACHGRRENRQASRRDAGRYNRAGRARTESARKTENEGLSNLERGRSRAVRLEGRGCDRVRHPLDQGQVRDGLGVHGQQGLFGGTAWGWVGGGDSTRPDQVPPGQKPSGSEGKQEGLDSGATPWRLPFTPPPARRRLLARALRRVRGGGL